MKKYLCHSTSTQITDQQEILAELVTNIHFEQQPDLEIKYGKEVKKMFKEDSYFHLSYLAEAIRIERIEIFTDYLKWAQVMMQSRDIPHQDLVRNLAFLDQACKQILPPDNYSTARDYINKGTESLKNQT
ncbi:MAG: hypothetical protein KF880_03540, partial [Ferruginibacter sp.]|nr:hypothetical protein [Ferruginibacter sp.]